MNVTGTANGLNQLTQVGAKSLTHDANGNVTMFGTRSFTYSSENLLLTGPNSTTLSYDPAMRLYQTVAGGVTTRMAYDGLNRIAEYACPDPCGGDGGSVIQRRFVHGPGMDQPLVQYEGTGTANRRFLSSDERGSVISLTDSAGALIAINKYDEYGNPRSGFVGPFGYTGQAWLPGMGGWYYKTRVYDRELGRFLQTDPAGGTNLYAYVGNDPIGHTDPSGMIREWYGQAGDDMSRFIDFTPRGTGRGSRSWDWGGQMATFTSGRIDSQILTNASNAWFDLNRLSERSGVSVDCLLTCSNAVIAAIMEPIGRGSGFNELFHQAGIVDDTTEYLSNLRAAWAAGLAGEAQAAGLITNAGYTIIGQQVYVETSLGLRVTDFLAVDMQDRLAGFEVKTGLTPRYNTLQQQKDSLIATEGGIIKSRIGLYPGSGLKYGDRVWYYTGWVYLMGPVF